MRKSQNFTEGKLFVPLLKFAMPVLAAMFLQTMYGAVDMLIVGQFAQAYDVSAVSTGSWIMYIITALVMGISMGTTVLLGRRLGEGRPREAGGVIGSSILLFGILSIAITALVVTFAPFFVSLMQVPPEAVEATLSYVRICGCGTVFIVAFNLLGSVFRGMGNSSVPLIAVAIACVTNIALDLVLVGVFHMATAGAAFATIFAQLVSVAISLLIVSRQKLPFSVTREDFRLRWSRIGEILRIGIPVAMQDVLVNISFLVITAIVNALGVIASAGVGVADKLCGFVMLAPSAFSQTLTSVVAQNTGAEKPERAKKALLYCVLTSLCVGVTMAAFSFFRGELLSALFSRDPEVIAASGLYLKAYAIDTVLVSVMFCLNGYFNGCGRTTFSMLQGIIGAFCVRIPVAYFMSRLENVNLFFIGLATPASSLLQTVMCVAYFLWLERRRRGRELG